MTTPYDALTTPLDLPSAVLALEPRDLARVIGRDAARDNFPDISNTELARLVLRGAAERTLAKDKTCATLPWASTCGILTEKEIDR